MGTRIRADISKKSKYWISRHRYYELKHFCLQYDEWKQYCAYCISAHSPDLLIGPRAQTEFLDPTSDRVIMMQQWRRKINMVESTVKDAAPEIYIYLLEAVTEEVSYDKLKARLSIPCGREMFYDRYRRFFWLLDKKHNTGDRE